jgi:hypothetical protein
MSLQDRLHAIRARVTAPEFLSGKVSANEVPFYAFDYPPTEEPVVDAFVAGQASDINRRGEASVLIVNLFDLLLSMLKDRGLYEKALHMNAVKGNTALMAALKGPLDPGKVAQAFMGRVRDAGPNVIFLTGIGAAYPFVRTHSLLNNLQPLLGQLPLVIFFPGRFSGQSLQLFGELQENSYYRAFKLV